MAETNGTASNEEFQKAVGVGPPIPEEGMSEEQRAEMEAEVEAMRAELRTTLDDIDTLKQLIDSKTKRANELKRKLGLTTLSEIKTDLSTGISAVKNSTAVQQTTETLNKLATSEPVQKTNEALKSFADTVRSRFSDMKNSDSFRNLEGKVGSAYGNVKEKVKTSQTIDSFYSTVSTSMSHIVGGGHPNNNGTGESDTAAVPTVNNGDADSKPAPTS